MDFCAGLRNCHKLVGIFLELFLRETTADESELNTISQMFQGEDAK